MNDETLVPIEKAAVYTLLGDEQRALDNLETAFEMRSKRIFHLKVEQIFFSLRSNARYTDLLKKIL